MSVASRGPATDARVLTDLPRLVSRVAVVVDGRTVARPLPGASVGANVAHLVRAIMSAVEGSQVDPDVLAKVAEATDSLVHAGDRDGLLAPALAATLSLVAASLPRTDDVLRTIQRGILSPVSFWLRAKTQIISKDTPNGWQIRVEVDAGGASVAVRHVRTESSLEPTVPARAFWITYEIALHLRGPAADTVDIYFSDVKFDPVTLDRSLALLLSALTKFNDCELASVETLSAQLATTRASSDSLASWSSSTNGYGDLIDPEHVLRLHDEQALHDRIVILEARKRAATR